MILVTIYVYTEILFDELCIWKIYNLNRCNYKLSCEGQFKINPHKSGLKASVNNLYDDCVNNDNLNLIFIEIEIADVAEEINR